LRLSFSDGVLETREDLAASIHQQPSRFEQDHALSQRFPDARGRFVDLIKTLREKTGQRVVVLVDGYDNPILDNLTEPRCRPSSAFAGSAPSWASPDRARVMRNGLRDICSVLKAPTPTSASHASGASAGSRR
jgi:hypothetical protein